MMKTKLDSLIALIDDPDDSVFQSVLEEIQKEDISVVDHLENVWETSLDELVQKRIEIIIQKIQLNDTKSKIRSWANKDSLDLFEGFFLISRYQYPELRLKPILNQLENIRKEIWLEFRNSLTSLEKITILNHIFFNHFKFHVDQLNPNSPQHCHINRIFETQKCNPVSIAVLYTLVGQSLKLPVYYIDVPKNPLVGYFDGEIALLANEEAEHSILFYINPSNKGAIIGPREVDYILPLTSDEDREKLSKACPDRVVIKRLVEKLILSYELIGANSKLGYLNEIAEIL